MAEEKEKILIEVDYESLDEYVSAAADAKKKLDELVEANKALKKNTEATAEQIEASNAEVRAARKEYNNATQSLDKMTSAQKANSKSYDGLYKQWQAAERQLKSMENTLVQNADGTFELTEEYKKAAKQVAEMKKTLNSFTTEVHDGRNNVGLYGEAIQEAFGGLSGQLSGIVPGFDKLQNGLKTAKAGFGSLRGAIMATGIGALVFALTGLFKYFTETKAGANFLAKATAALGAAFDTLMKVVQPLGAWLVKVFTEPKKAMNELVDFLKNQIIVRFNGLAKVIKGVWATISGRFEEGLRLMGEGASDAITGVENFRGKVQQLTNEMMAAAKAAAALVQAQKDLEQANVNATYSLADLQKRYEQLKAIADDDTRSMAERNKASVEAERIGRIMASKRVALAKEAYRLARMEMEQQKKAGKDTIEIQQKAADAYEAMRAAEQEYTAIVLEGRNRTRMIMLDDLELHLDSIEKGFDAIKAANVSAINDDKKTVAERRLILEALTATRNKALADEVAQIEKFSKKNIDLADLVASKDSVALDRKLRALGLSEKATIRLQDIVKNQIDTTTEFSDLDKTLDDKALERKTVFAGKQKEILDSMTSANIKAFQDRTKSEVELEAQLQTNLINRTVKDANVKAQKLLKIEQQKNRVIAEMDIQAQLETSLREEQLRDEKLRSDIEALAIEADQKNKLQQDAEAQNKANLLIIEQTFQEQKKALAAKTEAETTANMQAQIEMRKSALQQSLDTMANVFGQMSEIANKQSRVGKALAITQALINTYSSAVAAYNSAASIPVVGWVLGPIAAAAATAAGLANVAAIKSASAAGGGGGAAGGGRTVSSTFTAASPRVASSQAAAAQQGPVRAAQQTDTSAEKAGAATAKALQENPPVLYVDTFEAKQNEKNAVQVRSKI